MSNERIDAIASTTARAIFAHLEDLTHSMEWIGDDSGNEARAKIESIVRSEIEEYVKDLTHDVEKLTTRIGIKDAAIRQAFHALDALAARDRAHEDPGERIALMTALHVALNR